MPLSWNEIKGRAIAFAKEWADAGDERAQAQPFWIAWADVPDAANWVEGLREG